MPSNSTIPEKKFTPEPLDSSSASIHLSLSKLLADTFGDQITSVELLINQNSSFKCIYERLTNALPSGTCRLIEPDEFDLYVQGSKHDQKNQRHLVFPEMDLVMVVKSDRRISPEADDEYDFEGFSKSLRAFLMTSIKKEFQLQALLNNLFQSILGSNDLEIIFSAIVENLKPLFEFDRISLTTYHKEFDSFRIEATYEAPENTLCFKKQFIKSSDSSLGELLRLKKPMIVNRSDKTLVQGVISQQLIRKGLKTFLLHPLSDQGEVMGSLNIGSRREEAFSQADMLLIESICDLISGAIKNAAFHSELKSLDQVCKNAQEQFGRLEKYRNFLDITRGTLHSFNNHLALILGRAQILRQFSGEMIARSALEKGLDIIIKASTAASEEITALQCYSRMKTEDNVDLIQLKGMMEEILELSLPRWKSMVKGGIEFNLEIDGQIKVAGFRRKLQEVFLNILMNAVEAMEKGGTITIRVEKDGIMALISIIDRGKGIPKENLAQIYEPFFTTKENGTGLGLAASYKIIREHRGRIEIESNLNEGTTVKVRLPLDLTQYSGQAQVALPKKLSKIMIIDSNRVHRDLLSRILEKLDLEVTSGKSISEAEALTLQFNPDMLAIADNIKDGNPLEFIAQQKIIQPRIMTCLILSAGNHTDKSGLKPANIDLFLTKPFDPNAIAEMIQRLRQPENLS